MTENTEISVLVNLANQLGEIGRTEGPISSKFAQILENLNREYEHISPARPSAPDVFPQTDGSLSGDIVVFPRADGLVGDTSTFPPKPKPPKPSRP